MARAATNDFQIPETREALWDKVKRVMAEANGAASKNMGVVVICLCALIPGCGALLGGGIAWGRQSQQMETLRESKDEQKKVIDKLVEDGKRNEIEMHDLKLEVGRAKDLAMSLNGELEALKTYARKR